MKCSKWWSTVPIKKMTAGMLAVSMLVPLAACKKKQTASIDDMYQSGREILETDPYFSASINKLQLPVDESKTLEYWDVQNCQYAGSLAIVKYSFGYEIPEDKSMETMTYEEGLEYWHTAVGLFDEEGNHIKDLTENGDTMFNVCTDKDGNIYTLTTAFNPVFQDTMLVIQNLDDDGNVLDTISLSDTALSFSWEYMYKLSIIEDKFTISGPQGLAVYDKDATHLYDISDLDRTVGNALFQCDGKYYITSRSSDFNEMDMKIKEVDLNTGALGESIDASKLLSYSDIQATENGLYVSSTNGVYQFDLKTGELNLVFDWNETDVNRSLLWYVDVVPQSEDELFASCLKYEERGANMYLIHLTRAEKNPHAGKKIIVVGGFGIGYDTSFNDFIDTYNADPNNHARAVVRDYTENMEINGKAADVEQQIRLDIMSGTGPDVLVNMGDMASFQNENFMVDMNPYLDGQDGISREQYFDNIFRAHETNGKLYAVPLRFALTGFMVNSDLISNTGGWTYEEFEDASKNIPDSVSFIEGLEYDYFLELLMLSRMSEFVDYENKTVNFQNEDMENILRLAKEYGVAEEPEDEKQTLEYIGDGSYALEEDRRTEKIMAGLLGVTNNTLFSIVSYAISKDMLDGHANFLGYPSKDGSGMLCMTELSMGISATSKYQDLAWELIKAYLTFDYVSSEVLFENFSVNIETFDQEVHLQMERNNKSYERILKTWDAASMKGQLALITEEDIEDVKELIRSVSHTFSTDSAIMDVISEEAAAYFAGDRTAEEVLKNIENRASMVVKEQS